MVIAVLISQESIWCISYRYIIFYHIDIDICKCTYQYGIHHIYFWNVNKEILIWLTILIYDILLF